MGRNKKCNEIYQDSKIRKFVVEEYLNGKSLNIISKENNFPYNTIRTILIEEKIKMRNYKECQKKYFANENFFENIDTEDKAYWLGFFCADGYINNKNKNRSYKIGISLNNKDINHLEKFKKSIEFTGNIKTYKSSGYSENDYSRILITSDKLALDLINKGIDSNKTKNLTYPSQDIVPLYLQKHFIRGLIDGDGSIIICKDNNYKISFTGTYSICQGILNNFNLKNKVYSYKNKNCFYITIGGNIQVVNILDDIYNNATIYLDRKYQKYKEIKHLNNKVEFSSNTKC